MPDELDQTTKTNSLPPIGDSLRAEKYIQKLIKLIDSDKLTVHHTDLSKFNLTSMADHYFTNLGDHQIEVSHSRLPESGADSYVLIFTNIKFIQEDSATQKVVLAYMHLETNQFIKFKSAADDQIKKVKRAEEEKKLNQVLEPVDQVLDQMLDQSTENQPEPEKESLIDDVKTENPKSLSDYAQFGL